MKYGEYLEQRAVECKNKADFFMNDYYMFKFYMKAYTGFLIKLGALSVADAEKEI